MKKENRVQCWLCRNWILEKHAEEVPFLNTTEKVCIMCVERLEQQDEQNEMRWGMRQDAQRAREAAQGKYTIGPPGLPDDSELAEREDELESMDQGKNP